MSSTNSINKILVADTGPLLALARIDLCQLPSQLFDQCLVTGSVLDECIAKPDRVDAKRVLEAVDKHLFIPIADPTPRKALANLDSGEQTAIEQVLQSQGTLLIDERNGRTLAKSLGVKIIGTVGILLLAKRRQRIKELKPYLINLLNSGYYISDTLVQHALELANE